MNKPQKKIRRIVLGVGHPWFFSSYCGEMGSVGLTKEFNSGQKNLRLPKNVGNWNKVRLVMEVIS